MDMLFQEKELEPAQKLYEGASVSVAVPLPLAKVYSYAVPDGMALQPGRYVSVPVGGRHVVGVVWDSPPDDVRADKIKAVIEAHDFPPMCKAHRAFIEAMAAYTLIPLGHVLKMALSAPGALEPPKPLKLYSAQDRLPGAIKTTEAQGKVLRVLEDGESYRASELAERAGTSTGVITGMAAKHLIKLQERVPPPPCTRPDPEFASVALSDDQKNVVACLQDWMTSAGGYHAGLLDGVTGAGKTEVYFEAIAQALRNGKQALVLLPEIALSAAFLGRFEKRFGCRPALWHSNLTTAQRKRTWRGVASGETKVVIGARSALLLPYAELGVIIVDEEHDPAYKQEEGGIYHARDMAVLRAFKGGIPILMVSATPALETMVNAWNGKYQHFKLRARYGGALLPEISLIDLREDKLESQKFIASGLKTAMVETLRRGEQVLLFCNRRGYAPLTLCRTCGHRVECPRCTAWLVEHKRSGRLQCHHCGFSRSVPNHCPSCDDKNSMVACGPGVERIYAEAQELFPDASCVILASDLSETPEELKEQVRRIADGEVDIVIGTQIIAKGYHFPQLTCVGVVDADLGLTGGELRAAERTYQLLNQVSGRAGRGEKPGHVYLQTYMPDHRIMQALANGERDAFLEVEANEREIAHMPPYARLAGVIISGRDEGQVVETAKALGRAALHNDRVQTFGPAPAPMARLRGRFRYRLLVRADRDVNIQQTVANWVAGVKPPSDVRIMIDIDPQSFY